MDQAVKSLRQALSLEPQHAPARHNLEIAVRRRMMQQQQPPKPNPGDKEGKDGDTSTGMRRDAPARSPLRASSSRAEAARTQLLTKIGNDARRGQVEL